MINQLKEFILTQYPDKKIIFKYVNNPKQIFIIKMLCIKHKIIFVTYDNVYTITLFFHDEYLMLTTDMTFKSMKRSTCDFFKRHGDDYDYGYSVCPMF